MQKRGSGPASSEITPESVYVRRREFLKNSALAGVTAVTFGGGLQWLAGAGPPPDPPVDAKPVVAPIATAPPRQSTDDPLTPYQSVTTYNNYYEFGLDKGAPARNAPTLKPRPWTVAIEGEVAKPQTLDLETILGWFTLEE